MKRVALFFKRKWGQKIRLMLQRRSLRRLSFNTETGNDQKSGLPPEGTSWHKNSMISESAKDTISVVITCYDEGAILRCAFESLAAQSDQDFEVVVVNDASPDSVTNAICREVEQEHKARVAWRTQRGGPAAAKNHGAHEALGSIIVPLDADDTLPSATIALVRRAFREAPTAAFVFGNYVKRDLQTGTESLVDCSVLCGPHHFLEPTKFLERWILLGTSPCRRSAWLEIGGHPEVLSYGLHDVGFFMSLLANGHRGYYVAETIYEWNKSPTGVNSCALEDRNFRLILNNLKFFDKYGDGLAIRNRLFHEAMRFGDFGIAKRLAKEVLSTDFIAASVICAALLPERVTRFLYRLKSSRL